MIRAHGSFVGLRHVGYVEPRTQLFASKSRAQNENPMCVCVSQADHVLAQSKCTQKEKWQRK
jgi:hypothetical protein